MKFGEYFHLLCAFWMLCLIVAIKGKLSVASSETLTNYFAKICCAVSSGIFALSFMPTLIFVTLICVGEGAFV